jgi:hypothetical protein
LIVHRQIGKKGETDGSSDMQLRVDESTRNRSWILNHIACITLFTGILIASSIW